MLVLLDTVREIVSVPEQRNGVPVLFVLLLGGQLHVKQLQDYDKLQHERRRLPCVKAGRSLTYCGLTGW